MPKDNSAPVDFEGTHRAGKREFTGVQALRAVAALMVVAAHYLPPAGLGTWDDATQGVNVFFVISGFVMTFSSATIPMGLAGATLFMRRRLLRIVPLYWIATTMRTLELHHRFWRMDRGEWHYVLSSYLFLFSKVAVVDYPLRRSYFPILGVGWSLNFEMFFYGCFAVAILFRRSAFWLTPLFVLMAIGGWFARPSWPAAEFLLNSRLLLFLVGMLIGEMALRRRSIPVGMSWTLIGGWVGILVFFSHSTTRLHYSILSTLSAALVLAIVSIEDRLAGSIPKWLLTLGNASYVLYLVHPLLAWVFERARRGGGGGLYLSGVPLFVAQTVLCCCIAVALHFAVEKPLVNRLNRMFGDKGKPLLRA